MEGRGVREGLRLRLGKKGREIGLVRGARDDADRLSGERLHAGDGGRDPFSRDEARRRLVIGDREVDLRAGHRRRRDRGDDGVAFAGRQRIDQGVEAPRLDRAADFELLADGARNLDIEAGKRPVGEIEVQRRIVVGGEEPDRPDAREVRPLEPQRRIPETRRGGRLRGERRRRGEERGEGERRRREGNSSGRAAWS